jgi:hypothetical protein
MNTLARIPLEERALKKAWVGQGTSCFCCRDSGLLIDYLAAKYLIPGYTRHDAPVMCQRIQCEANYIWLDVEGAQKRVVRYRPEVLDTRATPEMCQEIHLRERARIEKICQEGEQGPSTTREALSNPAGILPSLPGLPPTSDDEIDF